MKKLVKTAKQQFEERLNELENPFIEKISNTTYYSCNDNDGHYVVLSKYEDSYDEYSEYINSKSLVDIYTDSDFLCSLVDYWNEYRHEPLKDLFEWYATADKDNPPFDVEVILQCCNSFSCTSFNDYYEEVPDVRIITAREQWEEASKDAREIPSNAGCTCKFNETEEGLVFYLYHFNSYESYHFPSFDELRKDGDFVSAYIAIVQKLHPEDLPLAIQWLGDGKYNMSDVTLWDIKEALEGREDEHLFFTDKELPQEQSIEEMIALTPEQQEKVKEFEAALNALKDSGIKIISYWDENEFFAVNGNCNVELDCSYYSSKKDYENSEDISALLQKKHRFPFSWDIYWGCDTCFCAKKL